MDKHPELARIQTDFMQTFLHATRGTGTHKYTLLETFVRLHGMSCQESLFQLQAGTSTLHSQKG